jgi:hypothetical protein
MMTTPDNFTGDVGMPWMLWEIRGAGRVRIDGNEYDIGSEDLAAAIQRPRKQIESVDVLSAQTPIQFIFFMNAMRYVLGPVNQVNIKGKDVWAVRVGTNSLTEEVRLDGGVTASYLKPQP